MTVLLNVSVSQLDIAADAFGWTKEHTQLRGAEVRRTWVRKGEKVTVDSEGDKIVHFAWVKDANNFAMVGNDHAGVEALVQLSQVA